MLKRLPENERALYGENRLGLAQGFPWLASPRASGWSIRRVGAGWPVRQLLECEIAAAPTAGERPAGAMVMRRTAVAVVFPACQVSHRRVLPAVSRKDDFAGTPAVSHGEEILRRLQLMQSTIRASARRKKTGETA